MRFAFVFVCATIVSAQSDPVVAVTGFGIRGRLTPDGGAAFKGIPYSRPPLAGLRWREPLWPKFTAKSQEYLAFTGEGAEAKSGTRREFCEVFYRGFE